MIIDFFVKQFLNYRIKKNKEDETKIQERYGIAGFEAYKKYKNFLSKGGKKTAWIHAVSVGESLSVLHFIEKLCQEGYFCILTTTTKTSAGIVASKLPENAVHQYNPLFLTKYVKHFFEVWKPEKVYFVESEIFPNAVKFLYKKAEVRLISARMSNKSFKLWKFARFFISKTLQKYTEIIAQNEHEANKFRFLSYNKANIVVGENMKIEAARVQAQQILNDNNSELSKKCASIKKDAKDRKIIVFGSIHEREFMHLVHQYTLITLKSKTSKYLGIFVLRYVEEKQKLQEMLISNGFEPILWSEYDKNDKDKKQKITEKSVIIVDEMGCLMNIYSICDIAVVCGNFVEGIGGHSPIEPVVFEKPTIVGPYCTKCQELVDDLKSKNQVIQTMDVVKEVLIKEALK